MLTPLIPRSPQSPRREPLLFLPKSVTLFLGLCAGLYVLQNFVFTPDMNLLILLNGAFIPARYSSSMPMPGSGFSLITSPVTYSLMHGSFAHLAVNMIWLAAFGAPLAERIGTKRFVLFWAFTAISAALLHYVLHASSGLPLVGASGSISGMMGAAARFGFRTEATAGARVLSGEQLSLGEAAANRTVLTFVGVWMLVNFISGIGSTGGSNNSAGIAWEAHIGGFLAGFLAVSLFDRASRT